MVTKCCCCSVNKKDLGKGGKVASSNDDDKKHLIGRGKARPSSGESAFSNSTFASALDHPTAYEDECDAKLDNEKSSGIVTLADESGDDEDLIDLTSNSQNFNHRLQLSPKVTFYDPNANPGSLREEESKILQQIISTLRYSVSSREKMKVEICYASREGRNWVQVALYVAAAPFPE